MAGESEKVDIKDPSAEDLQAEDIEVLDLNENVTARLRNPLHGISRDRLIRNVKDFAVEKGLTEHEDTLIKGAVLAQNPEHYNSLDVLSDEDKAVIAHERAHKWSHPLTM